MNSHGGGEKNIHTARFDFLNRARVQIYHLRKPFLRQVLVHTYASDVVSEHPQLLRLLSVQCHILLIALPEELNTAQWGVKLPSLTENMDHREKNSAFHGCCFTIHLLG